MERVSKLCVATNGRDLSRKIKIIESCVEAYPEGVTPKLIALRTRLNVNTVKSILPKMRNITKVMRGYYKVVNGGDTPSGVLVDLFDWNFHNLILTTTVSGVVSSHEKNYHYGLVDVHLYVSPSGKATFRVSSDYPLNVSSICFVAGMFSMLTNSSFSDIMVSTVEFNRDYKNLRLDGVKSIAVDSLVEQFKVYQKSVGLRVEHKSKVPMCVDSIVDMLSNNPNSLEFHLKLNKQGEVLDRLTVAVERTSNLLFRLLDK